MEELNISGNPIDDDLKLDPKPRELNHLRQWEKRFRAEARADNYSFFRDHLKRLELPVKPRLMLAGTVKLMQAIWVFTNVDNQMISGFLANQQYDLSNSPDPRYIFTFSLWGKAFPRVVVGSGRKYPLNLADLFGFPWRDYKVAGFDKIWISHPDWSPLTDNEFQQLETEVTEDLYFDYGKDEVDVYFDDSTDPCCLAVNIQERCNEIEDEE